MKTYSRIGFILILVMLLTSSSFAFAEYYTDQKETLRGLTGVFVLIENLDPEIEKDGLTRSQIRTDVELKLRLAGIKVLSKEERLKSPGMPYLYVHTNIFKMEDIIGYVYSISVLLTQTVLLERDMKNSSFADTWKTAYVGITSDLENIRMKIKGRVDKFINDYLAVNPK